MKECRLSHIQHSACFGRAVSLLFCTSTKPLAGFSQQASPHGANARQTGRQIRRLVKTDSQTDTGKNPWLWSRKQCQMLLVMSTYNHFVRHVSPRTSKYILYTRARQRSDMEPNLSMCARAHQVIIIAQRGILEAMSTVNTHTNTHTHILTPHPNPPRTHTPSSHSTWGV